MKTTNLEIVVKETGLTGEKAKIMVERFADYFALADELREKAHRIVVTSEDQLDDMRAAREMRLVLREKRLALERTRKILKEDALREGQAIDTIARILKDLIEPTEKYLEEQEKFIERRAATEAARIKAEAEARAEAARIKAEAEARAEQQRIADENARLREEAAKREAALKKEREEAAKREAALEREKTEAVAKAKAAVAARIKAEKISRGKLITCPHCKKIFELKE